VNTLSGYENEKKLIGYLDVVCSAGENPAKVIREKGEPDKNKKTATCADGMTGFRVRHGGEAGKVKIVNGVTMICASGNSGGYIGHSDSGATKEDWNCPSGQKIVGVSGRIGEYFDNIKFTCK
jgi:hypothetical protein